MTKHKIAFDMLCYYLDNARLNGTQLLRAFLRDDNVLLSMYADGDMFCIDSRTCNLTADDYAVIFSCNDAAQCHAAFNVMI